MLIAHSTIQHFLDKAFRKMMHFFCMLQWFLNCKPHCTFALADTFFCDLISLQAPLWSVGRRVWWFSYWMVWVAINVRFLNMKSTAWFWLSVTLWWTLSSTRFGTRTWGTPTNAFSASLGEECTSMRGLLASALSLWKQGHPLRKTAITPPV